MRKERGITLIALVVTIVVLLILAAVSISMLTGENGIIKRASEAKDETEQARVQELVDLAVNSLIGENLGSTNGITPEMVAEEVNEMESRDDVYAEGSEFPTKIIFPEEEREVEVDLEQKVDLNEIYEVAVDEEDIAPNDLFDYEIIDEAEVGALTLSALPTQKARIIRIKEEYCNSYKTSTTVDDTNYEIIYKGEKISDTLIIPYQVEIDGVRYKITEVQLLAPGETGSSGGNTFPKIETVIYPNTVEKIYGKATGDTSQSNTTVKTVILPNKLKTIGDSSFYGCESLENIEIPDTVISIGERAFNKCKSLTNITIPEGVTSIGNRAFERCSGLTKITIPDGVTSIESGVFSGCTSLTNITIPENVKIIESYAFDGCLGIANITIPETVSNVGFQAFCEWTSIQTINVPFKEGEVLDGWNEYWNSNCDATINYLK